LSDKSLEIDGIIGEKNIKQILQRLNIFMFEDLLDVVLRSCSSPESRSTITEMFVHDKYCIYHNIWHMTVRHMYERYLPGTEYTPTNYIEITPYTLYCAGIRTDSNHADYLIRNLTNVLKITEEELLLDIDNKLKEINFDLTPLDVLPQRLIPTTTLEKATLLTKFMNFPPLYDLYNFYQLYHKTIQTTFEALGDIFSNGASVSKFRTTACLWASFFHFSQSTFDKIDFHKISELDYFKSETDKINHVLGHSNNLIKLKKPVVCSSCGTPHVIENLPIETTMYIMCLHEYTLARKIGFQYFDEFQESQLENIQTYFQTFFSTINDVDDPKCLILVEGESENTSLPIIGFKARKLLKHDGIKVHNSCSKEQLLIDFQKYKRELPHMKLVVLLDSDAIKEMDTIKRMIKGKKDRYELFCIGKGTFEDLFDLCDSVKILNKLYPDAEEIFLSDFDKNKDFLSNIKRILYQKKKATFDKVIFAKEISFSLTSETIPIVIQSLIDKSIQLANL